MDIKLKEDFITRWKEYFNNAELPITFCYTDDKSGMEVSAPDALPECIVAALARVRNGRSLCIDSQSIKCKGGQSWLGFQTSRTPGAEFFVSTGIPGKFGGLRLYKSPEVARELDKRTPPFAAPAKYMIFKRWDKLEASDNPEIVIFFAMPDVLGGLYYLANFDFMGQGAVSLPVGSGCSSIVTYPYIESKQEHPRCVLGMFDPSARPFVPANTLTFTIPMKRFEVMAGNMDESFLTKEDWQKIQKRIT